MFQKMKNRVPRGIKVYISAPLTSARSDPNRLFALASQILRERSFEPVLPLYLPVSESGSSQRLDWQDVWCTSLEDQPFESACVQLVGAQTEMISRSDIVLCLMPHPSIGCAMEAAFAAFNGKPLVVVCSLETFYHPWLWTFADKVLLATDWVDGIHRACRVLSELLERSRSDDSDEA